MNTWKVILATLVIFGAGVVTGGLLVDFTGNFPRSQRRSAENPKHALTNAAQPAPGKFVRPLLAPNFFQRKDLLERLDRELKLDREQHDRIEKIIAEGQDRIGRLCAKIEPDVKDELGFTREKIADELRPDQKIQFAELMKRRPAARGTNAPPATPPH